MKTMVNTMKAMTITSYGGTEVFKEMDMPISELQDSELLVKVFASSVNPVDYKIRKGLLQTGIKPPQILGFDVSGQVEAVGKKVTDFKIGDNVYYLPRIIGKQGSYAEYHVVEESIVARKPSVLTHIEAASIPLVGSTAWDALVERTKVQIGETALIHAGAGGVGSFAIQLAKLCGAYVFTTTSTKNTDFAKKLGADKVIDYTQEDFIQFILDETDNLGVDVVLDTIGGETFTKSIEVTRPNGRIASIVRMSANLEKAFFKNITIHPVFVQSARYKLDVICSLIERGQLKATIDSVFPLSSIQKAHEKLEAGGVRGKIVIEIAKSN